MEVIGSPSITNMKTWINLQFMMELRVRIVAY